VRAAELLLNGRRWRVWKGINRTGWYAWLLGSSPQVLFHERTRREALAKAKGWDGR